MSSAAGAFSFQRGRGILSSAAGVILFSAGAGHSLICGGSIFSSAGAGHSFICAVPEYLLSRQPRPLEAKTHVHRARYCSHFAAVGSLSMPSATLSLQNRGRWKPFYISTGRAHENTSASSPEMSRLHFTKFPLSKGKSLVSGGGAFSFQRGPVHPFICGGSHSLFSEGGAFFHMQPEHSLFSEGGAFSRQRYRSIC